MRGSTAKEAVATYLETLRSALGTIAPYFDVRVSGNGKGSAPDAVVFNGAEPFPVPGTQPAIALRLRQAFQVQKNPDPKVHREARWRLNLAAYDYSLLHWDPTAANAEILAFHWHPESKQPGEDIVTFPHLHVGSRVLAEQRLSKMHIPTERVAMEDVLRLIIAEFHATSALPDWEKRINETRRIFEQAR